jgi:hypothetical protein
MLPLTFKLRLLDQADASATAAIKASHWLCQGEGRFEVSGRDVQSAARRSGADGDRVGPVISAAETDMASSAHPSSAERLTP